MVTNNRYSFYSQDMVKMGNLTGGIPNKLILWQMNFDEENDEFRLYYRRVSTHTIPSSTGTITEDQLKAYLKKVVDGDEPDWNSLKFGSDKTGLTPLSIHHLERSVMVFVVRKAKRWEFSADAVPFMVKQDRDHHYMMARAVELDGETVKLSEKPGKGCRVALFVADAAADRQQYGTGADKEFRTSFNIYVDLLLKRSDSLDEDRRMPIGIDPDVGHPGGSEP